MIKPIIEAASHSDRDESNKDLEMFSFKREGFHKAAAHAAALII